MKHDAEQTRLGHRYYMVEQAAGLVDQLSEIRSELLEVAERWTPWTSECQSDTDASARNLLQYLALRRHDLRDAQYTLIELGLSSLGGNEGHVQASVDAVLGALLALTEHSPHSFAEPAPIGFAGSRQLLEQRAVALFGSARRKRPTRIMVTMPSEAATDASLVRELLDAGMDCVRINCAHDEREHWARCANTYGRWSSEQVSTRGSSSICPVQSCVPDCCPHRRQGTPRASTCGCALGTRCCSHVPGRAGRPQRVKVSRLG